MKSERRNQKYASQILNTIRMEKVKFDRINHKVKQEMSVKYLRRIKEATPEN